MPASVTEGFEFDEAGQLTDRHGGTDTEEYGYDDNGNRIHLGLVEVGPNFFNTIGPYNRLAEDQLYTYLYDKEGNRIGRTAKSDGSYTTYAYDHRDRLTKVEEFSSGGLIDQRVVYAYDANDQLVLRDHQLQGTGPFVPVVEHYVNNGVDREIAFVDDELSRRYVQGPLTDQLLFDEVFNAAGQETGYFAPVTDHLGTVRAVLNQAEVIDQAVEYTSFGEITEIRDAAGNLVANYVIGPFGGDPIPESPNTAALDTVFGFQGRPLDHVTGLNNFRERWYDARTGKFISEDVARDGSNWYAAFGNDPWNTTDPSGTTAQGNPLNNLYGSFDAYAGGFSGGVTQAENLRLRNVNNSYNTNLLNSPTLNYNSASSPYAYGPVNTGNSSRNSTASRSTASFSGPVNTIADYDRKYGVPSTPKSVPTNFLTPLPVANGILLPPSAQTPKYTPIVDPARAHQAELDARMREYTRQENARAKKRCQEPF